ncbi:MAG: c-type cytochrome [Candidatus Tectomicrobia bacterium]|uniref:C-type cytochrome n=1 Tax=Tectimicrobiota bacterium TaxID=2528274 RepID=A0A932MKN7_UNCTE|nr:c-type cytochrome [Candidatus Tectomicrobia bacterium]
MMWRAGPILFFLLVSFMGGMTDPSVLRASESASKSIAEASLLFRRYCSACHGLEGRGDGPNAPSLGETQPRDLTDPGYMRKLSDAHLLKVIAEGGRAVERSPFMPPFGRTLPPGSLRALAAHVRSLHARKENTGKREAGPEELGARLVKELGCANCHKIGNLSPQPVAPALKRAGEKFQAPWLVDFLRKPSRIRPHGYLPLSYSRMPSFRLSQPEAEKLAAYLLAQGKPASSLPREAPQEEGKGFQLLLQHGCRACHNYDENGAVAGPDLEKLKDRLRLEWTARFIEDPRAFDREASMPALGVPPADARQIAALLVKAAAPKKNRPELAQQGRTLFENLGCPACHEGADAAKRPQGPPDLTHLGDKLQPAWLRGFLKDPHPLRFWLKARMPDFRLSDREADALARYFERHGRDPRAKNRPLGERAGPANPLSVEKGKELFELYECAKCHPSPGAAVQADEDAASLAPSLRDAGRRLKPGWVMRLLRDPQSIYPGTKMPDFFYSGGQPIEEDADAKMAALRDYLMSLKP